MLPSAAREFYATQQATSLTARNEVRRLWAKMGDDFDASWRRIGPAVNAVIIEGQRALAERADAYVPTVLAQLDIPDQPSGNFRPDSLAGMASDGRSLDTLTAQSVVSAKQAIAGGSSTTDALDQQSQWLQLVAQLQTADAARQAVGALIGVRKNVGGHVRVLNPPSCPRCAILGGRFYRWSTGFARHPRCDCTMAPVPSREYAQAEGFITDPMDAYRNGEIGSYRTLPDGSKQFVPHLTEAQVKAIDEGANITDVVNAYRGVSKTSAVTRTINRKAEARAGTLANPTTGIDPLAFIDPEVRFRSSTVAQNYPTPDGIYALAKGDRDEAIRLLKHYGYFR